MDTFASSAHMLIDGFATELRTGRVCPESTALRGPYPLETLRRIEPFADWIDHFCDFYAEEKTSARAEDARTVYPHRVDRRRATRIEDLLGGSVTGLLRFAHSTVDRMDGILVDLRRACDRYDERVRWMRTVVDTMALESDAVYDRIRRIDEAIEDPIATLKDHITAPLSVSTVRTSTMEYTHFVRGLNLLGSTLCAAIPHIVEHSKIRPSMATASMVPTSRIVRASCTRTSAELDAIGDHVAGFLHASLSTADVRTESALYRELVCRTKALEYAHLLARRTMHRYDRARAARTIQRAWLRHAYAPTTKVGRKRMLCAVQGMHDALGEGVQTTLR